ncbi:hypothetical protein ACHAWF_006085 [Thalassiosira exigua]
MGQCRSCLLRYLPFSGIEMGSGDNPTSDELLTAECVPQIHTIDTTMSAPSISVTNDLKNEVSGHGLALLDVPVEQDSAYWEWQVKTNEHPTLMFGVSNKRNSKFYEILAESSVPPEKHGTKFMCAVPNLNDGDVIGVAVRQSELPMIQLYVNGEMRVGGEVSRFRGTVFPSVYLPPGSSICATCFYREDQFKQGPPGPGIGPLIAERSLM